MTAVRTVRDTLAGSDPKLRAAALRALRHLCVASPSSCWRIAWREYVDLFVVSSLDRKNNLESLNERVEALKLFRWLVAATPADITEAHLSSVVAVAECSEDPLRYASVEALRELAVADISVLAHGDRRVVGLGAHRDRAARFPRLTQRASTSEANAAGGGGGAAAALGEDVHREPGSGLMALVRAVVPEAEVSEMAPQHVALGITLTLAHLLDEPSTRAYIRPPELQLLISPLTELQMSEPSKATPPAPQARSTMQLSSACLVAMCRSWSGLLSLASDPHGLRALLACVLQPPALRGHQLLDAIALALAMPHVSHQAPSRAPPPPRAPPRAPPNRPCTSACASLLAPPPHALPP